MSPLVQRPHRGSAPLPPVGSTGLGLVLREDVTGQQHGHLLASEPLLTKYQFPRMRGCALPPLAVAELADNFISAERPFDLSVPCSPRAPFHVLASCAGWSVWPSAITPVHTPLSSQHPPTPSICATCLASFPLCCSPPQSCDCYCVVPATQKLA